MLQKNTEDTLDGNINESILGSRRNWKLRAAAEKKKELIYDGLMKRVNKGRKISANNT